MSSNAATLPPNLARMVERFARQSDPKQRYEQLIWLAKKLPEFPEAEKVPENKVSGCVSQVQQTGLNVILTPSRANGFYNIFQKMKKQALSYQLSESGESLN